ncbi:MAG: hypothetical protein P4L31_00085 [Candidatus Babeliales bacterium]|nr:hypothetical protein [Candidatus Babeliales bacterium]
MSFIGLCGADFERLRFGIGRPDDREQVPDYVLHNFTQPRSEVEHLINQAVDMIKKLDG